jgi:polar amino acid transport system substrate-binding protein
MRFLLAPALAFLVSAAAVAQSPASILAPTGTLRATFLGGNPVQGFMDPKTGETSGLVPDLVKELAKRLGVPYVILYGPNAPAVIEQVRSHQADIGFLAYEEGRAQEIKFGTAFAIMHNSYVVRADSPIQKSSDVDRAGIKVAGVKSQSQGIYIRNNMKNATVKIMDTMPDLPEMERMFTSGEVDVMAMNRQRALNAQASSPRLRALGDSFLELEQCFVVAKGDEAKLGPIEKFVDEMRDSGFIQQSLQRAKVTGADAAPKKR